ncbi:AWS domain [Phytophthora cactorum]|nr:AWS domain [Phytophthora cactorum]
MMMYIREFICLMLIFVVMFIKGAIPYCKCEPRADWLLTCGADCDNRATQTECVQGHCATRTKCGNQLIQRSVNADLAMRLIAEKGVSLVADAPITEDEFVVQYVGDILYRKAYQERN